MHQLSFARLPFAPERKSLRDLDGRHVDQAVLVATACVTRSAAVRRSAALLRDASAAVSTGFFTVHEPVDSPGSSLGSRLLRRSLSAR
jgi:hypothetical protein